MRAIETLRIARTKVFFGPGPQLLCEKIEEHQSLRKACLSSGISYSKALRMLHDIEQELGRPIVSSSRGGSEGGGTRLTALGQALLQAYGKAQNEVSSMAQEIVDAHFAFLDTLQ